MRPWKGQEQSSPEMHRHWCWTVTPITGTEEAPHLNGVTEVGAYIISSAKDPLGPSYIKAKGCAEKEKYKTAPTPVPLYPESPP